MPARQKSTLTATAAKPDHRVRIRMYRHGLGDCFLLSFPKGRKKHFHMLVDCGVVLGTGEPGTVMRQVAQNVKDTTGGVLDVVVITHEHWDHLSGFDEKQARGVFDTMEIKQLWLAWTEDETDNLAKSLRAERQRKKEAVKAAKEAAEKNKLDQQAARMTELLSFFGAAASGAPGAEDDDAGGTGGALKFLKKKCSPTIIKTGTSVQMDGVDDVRIFVGARQGTTTQCERPILLEARDTDSATLPSGSPKRFSRHSVQVMNVPTLSLDFGPQTERLKNGG